MKKMNKVIAIIGTLLLVVVLIFVGLDGTFLNKKYSSVWSAKYFEQMDNDQSRMIANGIRASSSHNTQPWLIKIIGTNTIELYADMDKALPAVDSDYKQLLMSQGAYIESYKQGASQYGYNVDITYTLPNLSEKMPLIAILKVSKDENKVAVDTISSGTYDSIKTEGYSNLKNKLDQTISEYPGFSYTIIESSSEVEKLEGMLLEGTTIESKDKAATKELLDVFRFTEWDKNEYRYGLSLNALSGILKPFIQPIVKYTSNDWQAFGDSSIKDFKDRLVKQTKYILIKCNDASSLEYIHSGQIYQNLIFEVSDYNLRPSMQLLENFDAMKNSNIEFQQEYGGDGEVLMILGLHEKTGKSATSNPRHLVEDIIIQ